MVPKVCSINDCSGRMYVRGLCVKHYARAKKLDALPSRRSAEDRFWEKVDKSGQCWIWIAGKNEHGYGKFRNGSRTVRAHRFSFEKANGPIPNGLTIDHMCFNRACVNPSHLRLADRFQNQQNRSGAASDSKTGIRGVSWDSKARRYVAIVGHQGKRIYVGSFLTKEDAGEAAVAMRAELFTHSQN